MSEMGFAIAAMGLMRNGEELIVKTHAENSSRRWPPLPTGIGLIIFANQFHFRQKEARVKSA